MKHVRAFTIGLVLLMPLAATPAHAQRPDPDSPAGVEYALPLDQARDDADGRDDKPRRKPGRGGGAKDSPQLFGEGITRGGGGGASKGQDSADSRGAQAQDERDSRSATPGDDKSEDRPSGREAKGDGNSEDAARTAAAVDDGGGKTGLLLGLVAGVLVLGAAGGLALRALTRGRAG